MVTTSTFLSDTILFVRNDLITNITDPISTTRPLKEKFVMTSYPQRDVTYPLITVKKGNINFSEQLGSQSEMYLTLIQLEVRIWARNEIERVKLTEQVINRFRSNQFPQETVTTSLGQDLFDLTLISNVDIDEDGDAGIKSSVMTWQFSFMLGQS